MVQNIKDRKLCFCGKLAGMSRKEAETLARGAGAVVSSAPRGDLNLIVIGEAAPLGKTWGELRDSFDEELRDAFESGRLETITETTFWQWLGLHPEREGAPPLYTPAALADREKGQPVVKKIRFLQAENCSENRRFSFDFVRPILIFWRVKKGADRGGKDRGQKKKNRGHKSGAERTKRREEN